MKKLLAAIIFVGSFTALAGTADHFGRAEADALRIYGDVENGIEFFEGSWAEALKKSDKENKLIFLDAYAAWCGPCKMMARNTFTDKKVGEFFNENFINVKMDMEKHAEGPRLSKKFNLQAYPTIYFLDKNEEKVHYAIGYHQPKQLISLGEDALKK